MNWIFFSAGLLLGALITEYLLRRAFAGYLLTYMTRDEAETFLERVEAGKKHEE